MPKIIILVSVFGVSCLLTAFIMLDRLIKHQYENENADWAASGRPAGFFKSPPGTQKSLESAMARTMVYMKWLFSTPAWTTGNKRLTTSIWILRGSTLAWNLNCLYLFLEVFGRIFGGEA